MRLSAKKAIIISLLVAALLFLATALVPRLIGLQGVQSTIVQQLSASLHAEVSVEAIRWRWLPLPHFTLTGVHFTNEEMEGSIAKARVYPNWPALLFRHELKPGRITLFSPQLRLRKDITELSPEDFQFDKLPSLTLVIRDGTFAAPAVDLPDLVRIPPLTFSGINATVGLSPRRLKLKFNGATKSLQDLHVDGWIDLPSKHYDFIVDCRGLSLPGGRVAVGNGHVQPVASAVNFSSRLIGTGMERFGADVIGELPCLLFDVDGQKMPLSCGFGDFSIKKEGKNFALAIKKLELQKPNLTLQGQVGYTVGAPEAPPRWHVDLAAEGLDLTAIRATVLTLLPDDPIARKVCDIVRSGKAARATYRFDGTAADLEYLRSMTITADVAGAAIHVPEAKLDLTGVSGPILIKDGALTGKGLTARLGNSIGTKGSLLVGLADDHFGFDLDLDIDADLADLLPVLRQQVYDEDFQRELAHFSDLRGQAKGHLTLGDHLRHINVAVTVVSMAGNFRYDRLPWPVNVTGGGLFIDDVARQVRWQGIKGAMGPHRIRDSVGTVTWGKEPTVAMKNLAATLDSGDLHRALAAYPALFARIKPMLAVIDGPLSIDNGATLDGPAFEPEKWRYHLPLRAEGVSWQSPMLPGKVATRSAIAILDNDRLQLIASRNDFFGESLAVRGDFRHHLFQNWSGEFLLSGTVGNGAAAWVKEKGWVPPDFMVRIPATLDNLRVAWADETVAVNGTVIAGRGEKKQPRLRLDLRSTPQNPLAMRVDFITSAEQGRLTFDLLDHIPETFSCRWQGSLSGGTAAALLAEKDLLTGRLTGDFKVNVPARSAETLFQGRLQAERLQWYLGERTGLLSIGNLRLLGQGKKLAVERLQVGLGHNQSLLAAGVLSAQDKGLRVEGKVTSPFLSQQAIADLVDDLAATKERVVATSGGDDSGWSVTGAMDFDLARFVTGQKKSGNGKTSTILTWSPVKGRLKLHPGGQVAVDIGSAKLCCLDISGSWFSTEKLGDSHFKAITRCEPLPLLQEVLPCLGIHQDVIEGSFTFNADLQGAPKQWHKGVVTVHSDKGRILRMALLSKIFSVVNLTDLFTASEAPNVEKKGFPYSQMDLEADIKDNRLIIRKAVIRGEGLNLFARGEMDLLTLDADFTVLIAPFKTIDAIISKVPLIGRVIGGKNATIITIPVGIKGPINDPRVIPLQPSAIGVGLLNLVKDTLMLPFNILSPILPESKPESK